MVVVGFGAAGRAGKASAPVGARWLGRGLYDVSLLLVVVLPPLVLLVLLVWAAEPVLHEGLEDDPPPPPPEADAEGSEGKAEDAVGGGGRIAGDETHPAEAAAPRYPYAGVGPPRRVLFLSLRTLLECFWDGAPPGCAGLAAEALAQPLELDVAPCMPLRPGRLG